MNKDFLDEVQRQGWMIEVARADFVVAACRSAGCNMRAKLRQGVAVPSICSPSAHPHDIEIRSFEDIRVALRRRRQQLALDHNEVEDAAGMAIDQIRKAEKDNPYRVPNLNIIMEWCAALGLQVVLRPTNLPPKSLRLIEQTRDRTQIRNRTAERLNQARSRAPAQVEGP